MGEAVVGVARARVGILGNPGDGYDGKALACLLGNFCAQVTIRPSDTFRLDAGGVPIVDANVERWQDSEWLPPGAGLERLAFAALRRFFLYMAPGSSPNPRMNVHVETDIPREVGLAGSSAVIIAAMRAFASFANVDVSSFDLAEHALATELEDLEIACGAMDRVIQSYGGVLEMDLAAPRREDGYRTLRAELLPEMLVAWDPAGGTPSGVPHGGLRRRWLDRDQEVLDVIGELRGLVGAGVTALEAGNHTTFAELVNRNFDLRCRIFGVAQRDRDMVSIARDLGGAAKLCGSGGAVLMIPAVAEIPHYKHVFQSYGWHTFRPVIG